jgi:predicted nucleic acid-binding protein
VRSKAIFDTSVYIEAIQRGEESTDYPLLIDSLPVTYLCSVVSSELYVEARDHIAYKMIKGLSDRFKSLHRIVSPTHSSWNHVGKILSEIKRKEPQYRSKIPALFNDALIGLCALQIGAKLYTRNEADFRLIQRYRNFDLEVIKD